MASALHSSLELYGRDADDHAETLDHRWHEVLEAERVPAQRLQPNPVWLRYSDANGAITQRVVSVGALRIWNDRTYLIGHCGLRDDYRCFRVDRIAALANPQTGEVIDKASWLMAAFHPALSAPASERVFAPLPERPRDLPGQRQSHGWIWALLLVAIAGIAYERGPIQNWLQTTPSLMGAPAAQAQQPTVQSAPEPAPRWERVGELSDGERMQFASIRREFAQDRGTYDAAVAELCRARERCVVAFFLSGDQMPLGGTSRSFYANGGLGAWKPLAVWAGKTGVGQFSKWDCQRAGSKGAPPDALCKNR